MPSNAEPTSEREARVLWAPVDSTAELAAEELARVILRRFKTMLRAEQTLGCMMATLEVNFGKGGRGAGGIKLPLTEWAEHERLIRVLEALVERIAKLECEKEKGGE
jgi:hypothetical protein